MGKQDSFSLQLEWHLWRPTDHTFIPSAPPVSLSKVDAQLQVVRKLEEKEHLLQSSIGTGEKELGLRTQALEMNKRKVGDAFISSWVERWSCWLVGGIEGSELSLALQNLVFPGFGGVYQKAEESWKD